jgi:hypothetical protein
VWLREFSLPKVEPDCRLLQEVLGKIPGAERMVGLPSASAVSFVAKIKRLSSGEVLVRC